MHRLASVELLYPLKREFCRDLREPGSGRAFDLPKARMFSLPIHRIHQSMDPTSELPTIRQSETIFLGDGRSAEGSR
jgi:hypothetical protein